MEGSLKQLTHYRRACTVAQLAVLAPQPNSPRVTTSASSTKARCACLARPLRCLAHDACAAHPHTPSPDDGTRNRDDLIAMGSEGVNKDHWASFVDYRLSSRTKEQELGRKVSRGEVWIATHKHANGDFVNDEAREISVSDQGSVPINETNSQRQEGCD
ncbi:hypothetical protein Fmac_012626 [Flemingia macrophylla]|uniref:Uncharacterized protein n=1 Tax=Flemingia macrophylla TaxID=520843 RepID=A0ABD1MT04_9FABA